MGSRTRSFARCAACALWLLFLPSVAHAGAADKAVAEALFQKGRDAMDRSDYPTACSAFEESNRLDPAPGTMANLADCEEKRGQLTSAWQWYQEVVARLPEGDSRSQIAAERAAALKARLPTLTIKLAPGAPANTTIMRAGIQIRGASIGTALPIDPGDQQILVSAPGRPGRRYSVTLAEGQNVEITVEPGLPGQAEGAAAPAPAAATVAAPPGDTGAPAAPDSGGSRKKTLGYVLAGVGAAGIGTALVVGGIALGKKGTVDDHCDPKARTCDSDEAVDAASAGSTLTTVSNVAFAVGVLAGGAGVYLILTSKDQPATQVGAAPLPGGAAITLVRSF